MQRYILYFTWSMTNMLILNLAVADSLIMVFGLPEIVLFMINDGWKLGQTLCKLDRTILVAALYCSVLSLVAVCIERFIAIVFPFKAHVLCTKRRMYKVITVVWFISAVCSTPTAVYNRVKRMSVTAPKDFCVTEFHENRKTHEQYYQLFKYTESILFYFLPLVLQMVCYTVIGTRLFVGIEKLHRSSGGNSPSYFVGANCTINGANGTAHFAPSRRQNGRTATGHSDPLRARRGVVKMLLASVLIYLLSYSPHQVLLLYNTFSPDTTSSFAHTWLFYVLTTILAYINSAANPVLYCVFSESFRSKFKLIFHNFTSTFCCCCCPCCRERGLNPRNGHVEVQRAITLHSYATEYSSIVRKSTRKKAVPL